MAGRDNIKLVGNGVTIYIATRDVKENFTNGIKVINIPTKEDTPNTSSIINLNKVEYRYTITGTLVNGKLGTETHTNAMAKKVALRTMYGLGETIQMTWEGITYEVAVDKAEFSYVAKDEVYVESGTTTSTSSSKLVQSGQNFEDTVSIGYMVHNTSTNTFAQVTAVDSDTTLSLDGNIMISGNTYSIYAVKDGEVVYAVTISCVFGGDLI